MEYAIVIAMVVAAGGYLAWTIRRRVKGKASCGCGINPDDCPMKRSCPAAPEDEPGGGDY
jgi:hypothetical protein